MRYRFQFDDVFHHYGELVAGAWMTLQLSAISMIVGLALAILLAVGITGRSRSLAAAIRTYVEIIRNTPFLVQVMFVYFALPSIGLRLDPYSAGLIAMIVYVSAYSTEIVRAGMESVPSGQIDAARALGLRYLQILRLVILPRALRVVYPALTSQFILIMLSSSVLSVISTEELTAAASNIDSITFRTVEVYLVVAGIYLATSMFFYTAFYLIARIAFPAIPGSRS
jgi:polar amino acid transport system permease protein